MNREEMNGFLGRLKEKYEWASKMSVGEFIYDHFSWEQRSVDFEGYVISHENAFGGEGLGDRIGVVIKVQKDDIVQFVRVTGDYDSWGGPEFSYADFELVEPVQVMVTQYQAVE